MYKENVKLTNKRRTPLSLTNDFNDTFNMIDEMVNANSSWELVKITNKYDRCGYSWKIDKEESKTKISNFDDLWKYLCTKKGFNPRNNANRNKDFWDGVITILECEDVITSEVANNIWEEIERR